MKNEFGITILAQAAGYTTKGSKRAKVWQQLTKGGTVGEFKARVAKSFPGDNTQLAVRVLHAAVEDGFVKVAAVKKVKAAKTATPKAANAA